MVLKPYLVSLSEGEEEYGGVWAVWATDGFRALRKVGWGKGFSGVDVEELPVQDLFDRLDGESGSLQQWDEIQSWVDKWFSVIRLR